MFNFTSHFKDSGTLRKKGRHDFWFFSSRKRIREIKDKLRMKCGFDMSLKGNILSSKNEQVGKRTIIFIYTAKKRISRLNILMR